MTNPRAIRVATATLLGLVTVGAARAEGPVKAPSVGLNSSGLSYFSPEWMFSDLVKRSRDWGGKPGKFFTVDRDGWITWLAKDARGVTLVGDSNPAFQRNFPLGRYVLLYEGKGHLFVECARCREVSRAPGRVVVDVVDSSAVSVIVDSVDAYDHPRNVSLVPIELEKTFRTQPFHPKFLETLRSFAAFRHVGNQKTNGSLEVRWSDRTRPTQAFQDAESGVALEYLARLANVSGTDPWFCIPVRADDDYVRQFARTLFSVLDRDRTVYVEYGNEIWNDAHPFGIDARWVEERGRALNIPLLPSDDGSNMTYRLRYQVIRSRQIFEIFEKEMDALKIDRKRLVRVIASQASFFDRIRFTLDYRFPDGSYAYQHADALAIAPYFAGLWAPALTERAEKSWSVDDILDYAACSIAGPSREVPRCPETGEDSMRKIMRADHELAKARGLRLLGYEGGQHMMAWNGHGALGDKLAAANRSPRMKQIYERYLETWKESGGELMLLVNYVQPYSRFGYWGVLERQDQPVAEAPKLQGALEFMATHPRWWPDPAARAPGRR